MAEINTQGLKRTVQFDDNVHTILIAYEDRKGEWMNYAIDRAHFKRRIHQMEMILLPILKKKLAKLCTMSVSYHYGCILQIKDVDAIVHQCNCLTVKSHGLSQKISECFPWGDIYSHRTPVRGRNLAVTNHRGKP